MGFLDALLSRPQNSIDVGDFETGPHWQNVNSKSGVVINEQTAMRIVSVYACVTLIADAIRALPVDVYRKVEDSRVAVDRPPGWLTVPNPYQTWGQFVDYALHSLLTNGNGFIAVESLNMLGFPSRLEVIHPDDITVKKENGRKRFTVEGKTYDAYTSSNPDGRVLHILGHTADGVVGLSPIDQAKQALGSSSALEEYGNRFFSNGVSTSGVLEMPAGSVPTQEQLDGLSAQFRRKYAGLENAWKPIVLANGATYKPMTISNDQAQFVETAKLSTDEIARLYRVPPHLIGSVERSTSWGTGIEQQNIAFVTYTLNPWMTRLEDAFNTILPRGQFIKFNTNALLRGDASSRGAFYTTLGALKAVTVNEIRGWEDLPPFEDGDEPPPAPNESI